MEENQEAIRHVCRLCGMSFVSGKALGGHMRGHSHAVEDSGGTAGSHKISAESAAVYGLRENPKKSWKFSDSRRSRALNQEIPCVVCGKGFRSPRALSTHMRVHSGMVEEEEESVCKECDRSFFSMRALFGHMRCHSERFIAPTDGQSSNEASGPIRRKRSQRVRLGLPRPRSFSYFQSSSSVTEIDPEPEEAEAAVSLLLLSMGFGNCCGSDDDDPLASEANWSPGAEQIAENEDQDPASYGDGALVLMKKKRKKADSRVPLGKGVCEPGGFHSWSASRMAVKAGPEVPVNGFLEGDESAEHYESEEQKPVNDTCSVLENKLVASPMPEEGEGDGADSESAVFFARKKPRTGAGDGADSESAGFFEANQLKVGGKFSCRSCSKCFHSHQALGGHRAAGHRSGPTGCNRIEGNEAVETVTVGGFDLKGKRCHECSICFKVFRSGQALGGHKRAHFAEANAQPPQPAVMAEGHPGICDAFDLNLPTALEEAGEGSGDDLGPWWLGNKSPHEELLLGMISE